MKRPVRAQKHDDWMWGRSSGPRGELWSYLSHIGIPNTVGPSYNAEWKNTRAMKKVVFLAGVNGLASGRYFR